MELELRRINWKSNPAQMKEDIDHNFQLMESLLTDIFKQKLDNIRISKLDSESVFISGKNILSIMNERLDEKNVSIKVKKNLTVSGDSSNYFDISMVPDPDFESIQTESISSKHGFFKEIFSGNININEIFVTKEGIKNIERYEIGDGLELKDSNIKRVQIKKDLNLESLTSISFTSNSISVDSLLFKGTPIQKLWGSHTYISCGDNLYSSGTENAPKLSVSKNPIFDEVVTTDMTASTISAKKIKTEQIDSGKFVFNDKELNIFDTISIKDSTTKFYSNLFIHEDNITIGVDPIVDISAFKRTKFRIMGNGDSPIHQTFLIQKFGKADDKILKNDNVDFVIKGDGRVGIGVYEQLTSQLNVSSSDGFDQLRLFNSFTPLDSYDKRGAIGNISWDENYIYVKTKQDGNAQVLRFSKTL